MIDRILDKLGIELNEMQQDAMNAILHGNQDVVVLSPTGSGKTLAYLLPVSHRGDSGTRAGTAVGYRAQEHGQRTESHGLLRR